MYYLPLEEYLAIASAISRVLEKGARSDGAFRVERPLCIRVEREIFMLESRAGHVQRAPDFSEYSHTIDDCKYLIGERMSENARTAFSA